MKKNVLFALVTLAVTVAMTSCATTNFEKQVVGESLAMGTLPVKDFQVIGVTSVKATEKNKSGFISSSKDGSEIVYPLLMEKVIELGGHDIINVRISKKEISKSGFLFFGNNVTYEYTATGLVIKYTETLKGENGAQLQDINTTKNKYNSGSSLIPTSKIKLPFSK